MNNSKAAIIKSRIIEKLQLIFGMIILLLFGLCTIMALVDSSLSGSGMLPFCIFFDVIGILLIILSSRRKILIEKFKKYVAVISVDQTGSIANIAAVTGISENVVKKDLSLMIKRKYFVDAYIDEHTNCIVVSGLKNSASTTVESEQSQQTDHTETEVQYVTVTCKNCGGINKVVKGKVCECDFCGSALES